MDHLESQKLARAAKAAKREQNEKKSFQLARDIAFKRAQKTVDVSKLDLLYLLQESGHLPVSAARIVSTGHNPDSITITYTFVE